MEACDENNIKFIALPPNAIPVTATGRGVLSTAEGTLRSILRSGKKTSVGRRCGTLPNSQFLVLLKLLVDKLDIGNGGQNLLISFRKCGI